MDKSAQIMNHRDRQILCGLYLAKFDKKGLSYFGFAGFKEAFNGLGYGLQAKPASIKNYRDELDPFFPNTRKGWHNRPLRAHCARIFNALKDVDIEQMGEIIKTFLLPMGQVENIPNVKRVLSIHDADASSPFAKRLITGKAAEQYFAAKYSDMAEFSGLALTNVTGWGCGFDFKLEHPREKSTIAVEVKGIRSRSGPIQLTELEYDMADALRDRYYLVLVRNFAETPFHTVISNPVNSAIRFTKVERKEIRFLWTANVAG
jgi:Domain of unknown function (DUF3883)